jgi:heme-degrading monooxygenase HmoA
MHARVSTMQMEPARIDDAVNEFKQNVLPTIKEIDGFKGFTLVADRSSGKVIGTSYWESQDHMDASEEQVTEARQRTADAGGSQTPPQVDRFEVVHDTFMG